jgi:NAD(P)-dependent dehydrogenase (short-subunit alcohol dehydrogenase family)
VTGGATGIGAAAVGVLTAAGAEVAATYHQTPPPDELVATWLQCDVRDADAVSAMVQQAAGNLGGLDVLVNAAGLWQPGIPGHISADEISFLLDTNVKATILTNQAAYAVMKGAGGRIINFGSSEAVIGSRSRLSTPRRKARCRRGRDPRPAPGLPTKSPSTLWRRRCKHPAPTDCGISSVQMPAPSSISSSKR